MDKISAEVTCRTFGFLKGRTIQLPEGGYIVQDVQALKNGEEWQPVAQAVPLAAPESAGRRILIDAEFRRGPGVKLAEVESLTYSEQGCARLHELVQELYRAVPITPENYGILEQFRPHLGYFGKWDNEGEGRKGFEEVKHFLLSQVQVFESTKSRP